MKHLMILKSIMKEEEDEVLAKFPEGSFQRLFREQQKKASAIPNKYGYCWHPLMIKGCLYLRHLWHMKQSESLVVPITLIYTHACIESFSYSYL